MKHNKRVLSDWFPTALQTSRKCGRCVRMRWSWGREEARKGVSPKPQGLARRQVESIRQEPQPLCPSHRERRGNPAEQGWETRQQLPGPFLVAELEQLDLLSGATGQGGRSFSHRVVTPGRWSGQAPQAPLRPARRQVHHP